VDVVFAGLLFDDGNLGLDVRRLDVGDETPFEAIADPVFQIGYFLGKLVAGDDDLPARIVEGVEGMEKFLLGPFLAGDELDVVHEQAVDIAILVPETRHLVVTDAFDQLVHEGFCGDINDVQMGGEIEGLEADGIEKMGLSQSDPPVDEQGIIALGGLFRLLRHGHGSGVGKLIRGADDETLEGVFKIEGGRKLTAGAFLGRLVLPVRAGIENGLFRGFLFLGDDKIDMVRTSRRRPEGIGDHLVVVFHHPVPKETIGYGKADVLFIHEHNLEGFYPGFEIMFIKIFFNYIIYFFPLMIQISCPLSTTL